MQRKKCHHFLGNQPPPPVAVALFDHRVPVHASSSTVYAGKGGVHAADEWGIITKQLRLGDGGVFSVERIFCGGI